MNPIRSAILLVLLATGAAGAGAQLSIPGMKKAGNLGSVGSLAGLPNISGIGLKNAAGVLSYCTKNKLLGGSTDASALLGQLSKQPGVTSSKEYAAGQAGQILTGNGTKTSLNDYTQQLKTKACDMVLKQAKHLI